MKNAAAKTGVPLEGKVHGLTATYFRTKDLTGEKVVRIDPAIDFDWQEKPPIEVNPGESFSVRWEGEIEAPLSEKYTFHVEGNDQTRLWIDQKLIIDSQGNPGAGETTGSAVLEGGKRCAFKLEFKDKNWSASAKLSWSTASMAKALVPPDFLYTSAPADPAAGLQNNGLLGIYFSKPNLSGDFKVRVDPSIDFDWEESPPIPGYEANQYSVRWEGDLIPESTESYTLELETEENVRLWLDDQLLIQSGKQKKTELVSVPIELKAGEKYHLRIEMVEIGSQPTARLFWSSTSVSRSLIPGSYFIPAKPPPLPIAQPKLPAGLVMVDGSVLAQSIHSADTTSINVSNATRAPALSTLHVARILLQPLQKDVEGNLKPGRPGILLCNKDFVDGEFKQMTNGTIQVNSILFGLKTFDRGKVIAIVLRDCKAKPSTTSYVVRTADGSTLNADRLRLEKDYLLLDNPSLAEYKVPMGNLLEIEAGNSE
jgi:hypothetical protein